MAGRNPVHARIVERFAMPGMYSIARASILLIVGPSAAASSTPNCRDDPIRICPVARGCALNATESAVIECAFFR